MRDAGSLNRVARWLVAAIVVGLGLSAVASRATSFAPSDLVRNEFTQDYLSIKAVRDHIDPYAAERTLLDRYMPEAQPYVIRNPHAPAQIVLAWPVSFLSYRLARAIWLVIQAVFIACAIALLGRRLGWSRCLSGVVGVGALAIPVAQKELLSGNVNGLVLLLLVLGWRGMEKSSDGFGGAALGVAVALRVFPVFMVIPLLRRRRPRAFLRMLGTALGVGMLAFVAIGIGRLPAFRMSLTQNATYWRAAPFNVSLAAIPYRWLETTIWHMGVAQLPAVAAALALILVGACVVCAAATPARRSGDVYWSATPWMVLAAPLAWDSYLILVLPLAIVIIDRAVKRGVGPSPLAMVAFTALAIGVVPGVPIPGQHISLVALVLGYGLATYGLLLTGVSDFVRWPRISAA